MAASPLQQKAIEVRANKPNWQSYQQGNLITQDDYMLLTKLDNSAVEVRESIIKEKPTQCAKTMLSLVTNVSKDQTLQYSVTLFDDILQEDKSRVEIFHSYARQNKLQFWPQLLALLNRSDSYVAYQTSRIIAKLASWGKDQIQASDLDIYLVWLRDHLKLSTNEYVQTVAHCLQLMLRVNEYRQAFIKIDGINAITSAISTKASYQMQYQIIFCLWVLTFDPVTADNLSKCNLISILSDILSESVKEKVTRIILATFRNLLEKPTEKGNIHMNSAAMIQSKVLKHLQILEGRKWEDQDMVEDIQFINDTLQASVQDLSSFDEYSSEIKSGKLEWSPVHKSEKFWRENAPRLCEKNFELLKILIKILETSKDPLTLCVALYDLGEYVRHYPKGKTVMESLGGKTLVMSMLSHDDSNVRYESLLAVQKIMVHNWEYLGKQVEAPASTNKENAGGAPASAVKVN